MVDFSKHLKKNKPSAEAQAGIDMVARIFQGRIIEMDGQEPAELPASRPRTANEDKNVPLEKMFRCLADQPGCGLPKPANAFYKEIKELCSECALKAAQRHNTDLYWVPVIVHCYEVTRRIALEARSLATQEGLEKGYQALVINKGIDKGRNHYVKSVIENTKTDPMGQAWPTELYDRYRGWILKHYDVPPEKYSNLPKNGLMG